MAGRLQDVNLRGLRANQPLATDVASGTQYYVTDEQVTERASDTATGLGGVWEDISDGGSGSGGSSAVSPLPLFIDAEEPLDAFNLQITNNITSGGPPGPAGADGIQGLNGINGIDGEDGLDSFVPGPIGLQGAIGSQGIPGSDGKSGTPGNDGEDGLDSFVPGPVGPPGNTGATGPSGIKGDIGPPGLDADENEYPYLIPGPAGANGSGGGTSITTVAIPADADQAMAVNTLYTGTIAAYTADRTFTLPGTAAVGDECWIILETGDDLFELLITATAGDTLNGVAGGTEWSRLFISNEIVKMRCTVANTTWEVISDGRISQKGRLRLSTDATGETANTSTAPTDAGGAWTADIDNASITETATGEINTRRAGTFAYMATCTSVTSVTSGTFTVLLFKNGGATFVSADRTFANASSSVLRGYCLGSLVLVADDYIKYYYQSSAGSIGLDSSSAPTQASAFELIEVF